MQEIRRANKEDISRIAEILVFTKRVSYRPIFQNDQFSFINLQVLPLAQEYQEDKGRLGRTWVFDDGFERTGERMLEEGTPEYLVEMERR